MSKGGGPNSRDKLLGGLPVGSSDAPVHSYAAGSGQVRGAFLYSDIFPNERMDS